MLSGYNRYVNHSTYAGTAGSYATLGSRRQHNQQRAVTQFSTLQPPHSKVSTGLYAANRHLHKNEQHQYLRAADGADAAGISQDNSGSSSYGGSPGQKMVVPPTSRGGGAIFAALHSVEAAPAAATISTLSRTRSSSDISIKGKGDVSKARKEV